MIFYPVGTLRWLRFSTKTQTLIAKRVRQISRPSENFVSDISVTVHQINLICRSVFVMAYILVFYMQVQFLFGIIIIKKHKRKFLSPKKIARNCMRCVIND